MTPERGDASKLALGALLVGAVALSGGGVLAAVIGAAGGVGGNWVAEVLGKAVGAGPPPDEALRKAFGNSVREAVGELRKQYGQKRVQQDGQDAFTLLREAASDVAALTAPSEASDVIGVQRALGEALGQLLLGFPDAQTKLLREEMLAATARAFQRELARNQDAWRLYHGWLLHHLAHQSAAFAQALQSQPAASAILADAAALEARFDDFEAQLADTLDALREELLRAAREGAGALAPAGLSMQMDVGHEGTIEDAEMLADDVEGPAAMRMAGGDRSVIRGSRMVASRVRAQPPPSVDAAARQLVEVQRPASVPATLALTPTTSGATITWRSAALGTRTSRFISPYQGEDLDLVLRALDLLQFPSESLSTDDIAGLTRLNIPLQDGMLTQNAHRVVGEALFRAITADGEAAKALGSLRDRAVADGLPLQLGLSFPQDAVTLAALPWELLWDPADQSPLLLSRGPAGSLTRHLELSQPAPAPRTGGAPLRVLAVTPRANLDPQVHAAESVARAAAWRPLVDAGAVELLPDVSPATRVAVSDALRQCGPVDVLHFVGHGRFDNGTGYLVLDGPGGIDPTPIDDLAPAFSSARVQLAVMVACQSATVGASAATTDILGGVAPALMHAGVPLVVAMQLTVLQSAAIRASGVIYERLAAGASVQEAVAAVRPDLRAVERSAEQSSWYVPTLYMQWAGDVPARLRAKT